MIALMPVICWNTASPMPIASGRRHAGANTSPHEAVAGSLRSDASIDCMRTSGSIPGRARTIAARASSRRPMRRSQRGDSTAGSIATSSRIAGHRGDAEHDAPVALRGQRLVDEIRQEDADGDRELVRGDEASALRSGCELRRVQAVRQPRPRPRRTRRSAFLRPAPSRSVRVPRLQRPPRTAPPPRAAPCAFPAGRRARRRRASRRARRASPSSSPPRPGSTKA